MKVTIATVGEVIVANISALTIIVANALAVVLADNYHVLALLTTRCITLIISLAI